MKYIYSPDIVNIFGLAFANNVSMFVRKHVIPYEKNIFVTEMKSDIMASIVILP